MKGLLHRYPADQIKATNAAFPYLKDMDVLTFKKFNRLSRFKGLKSFLWIFYAPMLVIGKAYDIIYCDDSFPFYPILVKLLCPCSKVVLRIGDFHLMYYCSGPIYKILHEIEKIGWRMADRIIAINEVMASQIKEEVKTDVVVALDPVDPQDFPHRNGVKADRVMFHGLLTRNKNVDVLLDAARILPNVSFWIVGDGPDRKRLESIAPTNVKFKGWVAFNEMSYYISKCKIGVALRSNNPGNEYVVTSPYLQYGASGKPCLVTRRKVFGDYPWQFSGAIDLAYKIRYLLTRPEEGLRLRKHIIEKHNAKAIAYGISRYLQF